MHPELKTSVCRTGPLRGGRPLRGAYTGRGNVRHIGPPVGRDHLSSDQREDCNRSSGQEKVHMPRGGRSTRSGLVRQDKSL